MALSSDFALNKPVLRNKVTSFYLTNFIHMSTPYETQFKFEELDRSELTPEEQDDLNQATIARQEAHAPYSHFHVGAALRMKDGTVVSGWNAENVGYEVLHAEHNAIGRISKDARAAGMERITVIGGLEGSESTEPVTPCGSCRQKLLELLRPGDDPTVIMAGVRERVLRARLKDLLPMAFYPAALGK